MRGSKLGWGGDSWRFVANALGRKGWARNMVRGLTCGCLLGLCVHPSVAQTSNPRPFAPRLRAAQVAPDPPELMPHLAEPYGSNSAYDPIPAGPMADPRPMPGQVLDRSSALFNLPEVRVDDAEPTMEQSAPQDAQTIAAGTTNPALDPTPMLRTIHDELNSAARRESGQFDSLQQGLQKLRQATESMRKRALDDQKLLEAERRRARRAEQIAEDARQEAEQARLAAEQTLRHFQELKRETAKASAKTDTEQVTPSGAEPTPRGAPESSPPPERHGMPVADEALTGPRQPTQAEPIFTTETIVTSAVPVTDSAVDRESLANSLFGAKKYNLAMPVYAELAKTAQDTDDQLWFEYQLACCYRNLGSLPQAEKHYRVVAGHKNSYLAAMARWYLSLIQEQKTLKEQLAGWENMLSQVDNARNKPEVKR